ncbi:hypothetical protein H0H87_012400 [Tephrocybe sp. NHM501043]|nr:hypothetical protein H0H87_012400 [Tephrocybe sp. NHM501043]
MEASTSLASGTQGRQKRILPSRARRGGFVVGTCDADVMILETQRRKPENEPLIPADTLFLLTTNSALASTSSTSYQVNVYANERYFERPEVLEAYRKQKVIETPEFKSLGDAPVGRLRARSSAGMTEDGPVETSDTVYEKRHRKYETFEKRFRLREKEKLKHEQYKLKERIEQLRVMDPSAFLSLPDDLFPPPLHPRDNEHDVETEDILGLPLQSNPNYIEGVRRRSEMLKIASTIEDRFRVLLPPDKKIKTTTNQTAIEPVVESEPPNQMRKQKRAHPEPVPLVETVSRGNEGFKFKIKWNTDKSKPPPPKHTYSQHRKQSAPIPKGQPNKKTVTTLVGPASPSNPVVKDFFDRTFPAPNSAPSSPSHPSYTPPPRRRSIMSPPSPLSNPDIAFLPPYSPETYGGHLSTSTRISASTDFQESISVASRLSAFPPPHKRVKLSPTPTSPSSRQPSREYSVPPIASFSTRHRSSSHASTVQSSRREPHGLLVTHAIRSSSSRASKGQRHLYAFGGKVKNELFIEEREFELPSWALPTLTETRRNIKSYDDFVEVIPRTSYLSEDEFSVEY